MRERNATSVLILKEVKEEPEKKEHNGMRSIHENRRRGQADENNSRFYTK